jgi:multiple sugar transport system permease protein
MNYIREKQLIFRCLITFICFAGALLCVYPFVWMISTSFKMEIDVFDFPFRIIPKRWNFKNYFTIFHDSNFFIFYLNSIKITVLSVFGNLFFSSCAAYAFARLNFKGRDFIFMLYIATLMIPLQVILLPKFILFQKLGLYDTHMALILPGMVSAFSVFFLRQTYKSIPMELSDAGRIDGASQMRIYFQLILPLAKGALITVMVLAIIDSWNDYMQPLVLLKSIANFTIPIGLDWFQTTNSTNYSLIMAGTVCALIPILIVFIFTQRFYIESLATSGLKG